MSTAGGSTRRKASGGFPKKLQGIRKMFNTKNTAGAVLRLWWLWCLIFLTVFAYWSWALPARGGELLGLDEFYIYRLSEYAYMHNFQLPWIDYLRYWPDGAVTARSDYILDLYLPILLYYAFLFVGVNMTFFNFALIFPAISGAFSVFVMYWIGKEIFNDKRAGLLSSLFLATGIGYISRASGALYEKESVGGPLLILFVYLFIKSYKKGSLSWGVASGITLAALSISWGGSSIAYYVIPPFLMLVLVSNKCNFGMIKTTASAFLPGVAIQQFFPFTAAWFSLENMLVYAALGLMLTRYAVERYGIVKEDKLQYFIPAAFIVLVVSFLVGTMFSDLLWGLMHSFMHLFTMEKSFMGETVAEQMPGDWNEITGRFDISFALSTFPQLSQFRALFSVWFLMLAGMGALLYATAKKRGPAYLISAFAISLVSFINPIAAVFLIFLWIVALKFIFNNIDEGKDLYVFIALWLAMSVVTVLSMVRLVFFVGPPAALAAAFAVSKGAGVLAESKKLSSYTFSALKRRIPIMAIPVAIYLTLLIAANMTAGYAYCNGLSTSFNGYWADAMKYMRTETPVNSSILSWWDFGYWFQTRGERPSIADGGNINGTVNTQIADWFVSDSRNWTSFRPWLIGKDVKYILMDYTLPGKYGAISKIASRGKNVIGMLQFQQTGSYPQENKTIIEYKAGEYAIWLPVSSAGGIAGPPMFMITREGQYVGRTYINDMCTTSGIIHINTPEGSQTMPGCITITAYGLFYIPPEAEFSIFTNLMFMDGYGNPDVTKVYDNQLIKIYKLQINETFAG